MKNNKMRKILLLSMLLVITVLCAVGCKKDAKVNPTTAVTLPTGTLDRATYIGMIGTEFGYEDYVTENSMFSDVKTTDQYFKQIQACAEWDVIDNSGEFKPNDKVTLKYALETAVKAIGTEKVKSSGANITDDKLVEFYATNIAGIDISNPDVVISVESANQIIEHAVNYKNDLILPQSQVIELKPSIKTANRDIILNYDGTTGMLTDVSSYSVGDIVYWEDLNGGPVAIKITSIDEGKFNYTVPNVEEVYERISITGTYNGKVIDVISASDGTDVSFGNKLHDEIKNYGMAYSPKSFNKFRTVGNNVKVENGDDYIRFRANAETSIKTDDTTANATGEFIAEITDIKVTFDYDTKNILKPNYVGAKVSFNTEVSSTITGEFSKSIPLGEAWISVYGPIQMRLVFTANIGADGEVSISYTTENVLEAGWEKGKGLKKSFNSTPELNFNAEATVTAEVNSLADLVIGFRIFGKNYSKSVINAEFTTGLVAIAKTEGDLLSTEPLCTDVLVYVPLRWGLNQEDCILTSISDKLKHKQTVWDSENSKFKLHFHFEEGARTTDDKCTRGEGKEVVQKEVDEYGNPYDELELFEFEVIDFDFIRLGKYIYVLDINEEIAIEVESLPDGYTQSDLVYEITDKNVCSATSGKIIAKGAGSTIVKVKTSDGTYSASIVITVYENSSVEGFEPL